MTKQKKIGKDVIKKGTIGIISTPKEHEEFQKWKEEQEERRQEKKAEIHYRLPSEEPSDEQLIKEKEKEMAKLAEARRKGLLKNVHVTEHYRGRPKKEEDEKVV